MDSDCMDQELQPVIRDFRDSDFEAVLELWEPVGLGGKHRGDSLEVIRKTLDAGGRFLVMEMPGDGPLLGTSWLTTDARRTYLHHFGIAAGYQGKKLSHRLMEATLEAAREMGLQLKLEVHKDNLVAVNLYQKYGFRYLGDYDVYIIREFPE